MTGAELIAASGVAVCNRAWLCAIAASELRLATVLGCVRAIVCSGRGVLTPPTWSE